MVTQGALHPARRPGFLMIEMMVAMALLVIVLLPIAYSLASEQRFARALYQRAIAMEIVDGETEVLAAGAWHSCPGGVSEYHVSAAAAANLPPGRFWLTVASGTVRLEWRPEAKTHGGGVVREARIP
jgi:type II secretory pathway pseudopilin PulG